MKKIKRRILTGFLFCLLFLMSLSVFGASEKRCSVKFYTNSGSTSSVLKKYNKSVPAGTVIRLPRVSYTGYQVLGWSLKKGQKTADYKSGKKVKVTGNVKLYLVRQKKKLSCSILP